MEYGNTADQYYAGYTTGIGECAMLNDLPAGQQVYLITGYTDLRRSIDGLASIIQGQLNLEPFSTALFLFCGRRRDRIKGLLWESDGFLLLYKRLDNGCFQWPRSEMEAKLLTPQQVRWLLEGLKIEHPGLPTNYDIGSTLSALKYFVRLIANANEWKFSVPPVLSS